MGVPSVAETRGYCTEFGLRPEADGWFATQDGGPQLRIVPAPTRRLVEPHVAADDADDLDRAAARLARLGVPAGRARASLTAVEAATGIRASLGVAPRLDQAAVPATDYNGPGRIERASQRTSGILRTERVRPRKLGHAVAGTIDLAATTAFFADGLGFKGAITSRAPARSCAARPTITTCPGGPRRPDDRQPFRRLTGRTQGT